MLSVSVEKKNEGTLNINNSPEKKRYTRRRYLLHCTPKRSWAYSIYISNMHKAIFGCLQKRGRGAAGRYHRILIWKEDSVAQHAKQDELNVLIK